MSVEKGERMPRAWYLGSSVFLAIRGIQKITLSASLCLLGAGRRQTGMGLIEVPKPLTSTHET